MSYDELVRRLDAIGEEEMYQAPATTRATIEEAMSAIERLQAELAEAVAKEREACWQAAWRAEPLHDHPVSKEDFDAWRYGKDCAAAAIRERT